MDVRIATMEDYTDIVRLLGQLNPDDPPPSSEHRAAYARIVASEQLCIVVASVDSRVVSTCYLNVVPNLTRGARPYALIENVVTDSAYRNRGHGKAVVAYAIERGWAAGCYKVMLMTGRDDDAVTGFYRGCGFSADDKTAFVQRRAV